MFTTVTAPGIQRGVAITTAIRHGDTGAAVRRVLHRDLRGSGEEKRAMLVGFQGQALDRGLKQTRPTRDNQWKLGSGSSGDDPALDEYFQFFLSGVQPVRDEAVMDFDRDALRGG